MNQIYIQIPHTRPIICIKCNDIELLEWIYISYIPFSQKEFEQINDSIALMTFTIIKDNNIFYLLFDGQKIVANNRNKIIGRVCHLINCLISTDEPYVGLHCAMLSHNNINYLLVGPTGIGKSTLSMYLSEKGYQYFTDDSILINCNNKALIPFVKTIHLREDGCKILERYNIQVDKNNVYLGEEIRYRQERVTNKVRQDNGVILVFLIREEGKSASASLLNKQTALEKLVKNVVFLKNFERSIVYALKLVSTTDCYEIRYSKLEEAKRLLDLLGEKK